MNSSCLSLGIAERWIRIEHVANTLCAWKIRNRNCPFPDYIRALFNSHDSIFEIGHKPGALMLLRFAILAGDMQQVVVQLNDFVRDIARFIGRGIRTKPKMNEPVKWRRIRFDFTTLQTRKRS